MDIQQQHIQDLGFGVTVFGVTIIDYKQINRKLEN